MTSESLSQNEIDLLFSGGGGAATETTTDQKQDVQIYDFRKPARISKERSRSLSAMYGLMAKSIEGWITGRTRDQLDVELQSVEQLTFGEFVLALPSPCASYIVNVGGGNQQGVVDIGYEFGYYIVDRLLGGVGDHQVPERPFTPLERRVVRIVADRIAFQLSEAWKDYVRLDLDVDGFESIPEMIRVANREDPVLVANLLVTAGKMSSLMMLCLPFATVEEFFTGSGARRPEQPQGTPEERAADFQSLKGTVRDSRISVGARWPAFRASLRELASLSVGDVIPTTITADTPLDILISEQRRFIGAPGRDGQNLAIRVLDRVKPEPEDVIEAAREFGTLN